MALIETIKIDKIEVVGDFKHLMVRERIDIKDDQTNEVKASSYHRKSFAPGDDISSQDQEVQDIANVVWTKEIKTAYQALSKPNE